MNERLEWYELTTEEIAALTEEQVRDYCRVAAMEAGVVLSPTEPEFLPEDKPVLAYQTLYVVEAETMPDGIAFETREAAEEFTRLAVVGCNTKYLGQGWAASIKIIKPMTGLEIKQQDDFVTETEYERARTALDEYGENVKHNKDLRTEVDKRATAYERATREVWSDWHQARQRMHELEEVRRCLQEYRELAKDEESAIACMKKAYDSPELLADALGKDWDVITLREEPF